MLMACANNAGVTLRVANNINVSTAPSLFLMWYQLIARMARGGMAVVYQAAWRHVVDAICGMISKLIVPCATSKYENIYRHQW